MPNPDRTASQPSHCLAGAVARLGGPLVIVDVGAQALASEEHVYESLRRASVPLSVVGFEPQADRAAHRRAADGGSSRILEAFVGDGGTHRLYPASSSGSWSLYPLRPERCGTIVSLARLHDWPGEEVRTSRLDDLLADLPVVDLLKLDIEGAELMALRSGQDVLTRTAAVHAETAFVQFRYDQPLFADVDAFLRAQGFGLMRLHNAAMRAAVAPSWRQAPDRLMWADSVFFADEESASDRALLAQAILAGAVYGMHTVAERLLALYDARRGTALAADYTAPAAWRPDSALLHWAAGQTNAALLGREEIEQAARMMDTAGLPPHPDRPKCWDTMLATVHAATLAPRDAPILDAGAERYSTFLPGLRRLGFTDLTGINTVFTAEDMADGVRYRPGDVTRSDLPTAHFGFVACLSVVEHGVDLAAFVREQARILQPGGHLFVSFDYWEIPIETGDAVAYGVPVRILTWADVRHMTEVADASGLEPVSPFIFECGEKAVTWERFGLHYTFANALFRRRTSI